MKKLLFLFAFALCFLSVDAQTIARWGMIPYSLSNPSAAPGIYEAQAWLNFTTGSFHTYNRENRRWEKKANEPGYAEFGISNDTSTVTFAATTAAPVEDLTAGQLSQDFVMLADSALKYTGRATSKFLITYHATISFSEGANVISMWLQVGTTPQLRSRSRQTTTLTTEKEQISGSAIVTLAQNETVRLFAVPITHTGSDALSVFECNVTVVQLR